MHIEVRYYLTSLKDIGERHTAYALTGIENGLYRQLDTVFREDDMTLSDRNAALNQSILNKAYLSLSKRLRKIFGWNCNAALFQTLTLMDSGTFARSVEITPKKARYPDNGPRP